MAKRLGLHTVRVGVASRTACPEGRLVSFGLAGALRRAAHRRRPRRDARRRRDRRDALGGTGPRRPRGARRRSFSAATSSSTMRPSARRLREASGADAVDMESGVLARSGRLAGVVRAISDDAGSAVEGVDTTVHADGRTDVVGLLRWVVDAPRRRGSLDARRRARRCARSKRRWRHERAASSSPRRARSAPASTARSRSSSGCSSSTARRSTSATRSSTTSTSCAGSRSSAPSSSRTSPRFPEGEICVLSAHGVAPAVKENAERRGLRVVDATCPLVNKVHAEARRYADSGHLVALVGHENHVEVIGTLGERPGLDGRDRVARAGARRSKTDKPVAVITQTTLSLDDVAPIVDALGESLGTLRRPHADDICYATQNRQDAVKAMVVAGRDARARDRLGDELERAAARRGRAGGRRAGDAHRRRERARRGADRRPRDDRPHRRRVDARGARAGDRARLAEAATRCRRRSRSRRRTSTSGCPRRSHAHDEHRGPVLDRRGPAVAVGDGHHERRLARGRRARASARASPTSTATSTLSLVRVQERETGFFEDLEQLLERVVPGEAALARAPARVPPRPALGAGAVRRRAPLPRPVAADPPLLARRAAPSRLDAHARRVGERVPSGLRCSS